MNIIGLIEMHPFDNTDAFTCLRVVNSSGKMFDLPITQEQLEIIVNNLPLPNEDAEEKEAFSEEHELQNAEPLTYSRSSVRPPPQEPPIVLNTNHYSMGQAMGWDEDDDL